MEGDSPNGDNHPNGNRHIAGSDQLYVANAADDVGSAARVIRFLLCQSELFRFIVITILSK